ncbi:hypothetical protein LXN10_05535 [Arcobacter sp. KX21116]|uniref:hypothetical protein n=1 Tax=Arcobacter iocasae TaxID=2906515 RepID=UPI0035D44C03
MKKIAFIWPAGFPLNRMIWPQDFLNILANYFFIDLYWGQKENHFQGSTLKLHENINVISYGILEHYVKQDFSDIKPYLIESLTSGNIQYLYNSIQKNNYDYCIANEKSSLVIAKEFMQKNTKIIYWPTELYTMESHADSHHRLPIQLDYERKVINSIDLIIHADENREKEFFRICQKEFFTKKLYFPISLKREKISNSTNKSYHNLFNLEKQKKIILYNGLISVHKRFIIDIVIAAQKMPEEVVVVLSGLHNGDSELLRIIKLLDKKGQIFIDTILHSPEERHNLFCTADIGLAFYVEDDVNELLTIMSSDKIASYTRAGLPIISFDYSNYINIYGKVKFGIGIDEFQNINRAITEILAHYDEYSKNSLSAYEKYYCLDNNINSLLKTLDKL